MVVLYHTIPPISWPRKTPACFSWPVVGEPPVGSPEKPRHGPNGFGHFLSEYCIQNLRLWDGCLAWSFWYVWMAKTTTKMWQSTLLYDFVSRNLRYSLIVYLYNICMIPDDLCVRSNYECPGTSDNWIRLPDPWFIIAQPHRLKGWL